MYLSSNKLSCIVLTATDDNGSGMAALLEVAKAIAEHPSNYSAIFVAFDFEETVSSSFAYFQAVHICID